MQLLIIEADVMHRILDAVSRHLGSVKTPSEIQILVGIAVDAHAQIDTAA